MCTFKFPQDERNFTERIETQELIAKRELFLTDLNAKYTININTSIKYVNMIIT